MSRILVVDDEARVRTVLRRTLANEGHSVTEAADGAAALADAHRGVDLVLLDMMMPGMSGIDVLETMRAQGDPRTVIVLSAVSQVALRVRALDAGAVDYLTKPFHPAELVARVRRHLVSSTDTALTLAPVDSRFLVVGPVTLDLERRRAVVGRGAEVVLSEREFVLLAHLMRRAGRVCGRDELLHDVWGMDFDPGSNVVEVAVRRLRKRMPALPIETIRSVGYCFAQAAAIAV